MVQITERLRPHYISLSGSSSLERCGELQSQHRTMRMPCSAMMVLLSAWAVQPHASAQTLDADTDTAMPLMTSFGEDSSPGRTENHSRQVSASMRLYFSRMSARELREGCRVAAKINKTWDKKRNMVFAFLLLASGSIKASR